MEANFDHELVLYWSSAYVLTIFFPAKSHLVLLSRKQKVESRVKPRYGATVCPRYTESGGKLKHCVIGNFCPDPFMGFKWGWCYIGEGCAIFGFVLSFAVLPISCRISPCVKSSRRGPIIGLVRTAWIWRNIWNCGAATLTGEKQMTWMKPVSAPVFPPQNLWVKKF
jgi:hypothetical protein